MSVFFILFGLPVSFDMIKFLLVPEYSARVQAEESAADLLNSSRVSEEHHIEDLRPLMPHPLLSRSLYRQQVQLLANGMFLQSFLPSVSVLRCTIFLL